MSLQQCPVCSYENVEFNSRDALDTLFYCECPRCGQYEISETALYEIASKLTYFRAKLSAWIRDRQERGKHLPKLTTYLFDDVVQNLPDYSVPQKQLLLLRVIEVRSKYKPGDATFLNSQKDYPLAWCCDEAELVYLVNELNNRGLLEELSDVPGLVECRITTTGWEYLEEHDTDPAFSNQVFVAMRFVDDMEPVWKDGIKPAIKDAGYDPYRVDKDEHNDRIDDKIITEIKNSKFLIADVTHQSQGVYFEAGFAQGLNRPVIWCVKESDLKSVHFDTRQFNHIVWETAEDLKEKLYYRICATIGESEGKTVD